VTSNDFGTAQNRPGQDGRIQVGQASLFVIGALIPLAANFFLLPFLWHKLSPEDYGVLAIAEMQAALFGIFWGLSLEAALARSYFEWPAAERRASVGTLWLANWGLVLGFGALSILVSALFSEMVFPRVEFFPLIFLGLSYAVLQRLRLIVLATLRVMARPKMFLVFTLGSVILSITMVVWLVFMQERGLLGYLIAINASGVLVAIASALIMARLSQVAFSKATCREALDYSLPLIPAALIGSVAGIIDRFLIERFLGLNSLGIYALCQRFSGLLESVNDALKMSYAPFAFRMISERPKGFREVVATARIRYYAIIALGTLALGLFIGNFVELIGRADYAPVARYLPWILLATLFNLSYPYFGSGLLFAKRTDLVWMPMALQTTSVALLGLLLIPVGGLAGAIVAKILASILFACFAAYLAHQHFPIPVSWGALVVLLCIGVAGVVLSEHIHVNLTLKIVFFMMAMFVIGAFFWSGRLVNKRSN